ncbi:BnaAnng10450D [Brassica napus]|uniref:BnaAnng10450D protein n=1 Tax=Brassica napus TaxID=3708 RepID=A0A078IKK4_BRANA|nr:BnaAnng10450D [Brassica napus]
MQTKRLLNTPSHQQSLTTDRRPKRRIQSLQKLATFSYNILSDPNKRGNYDTAGFEAVDAEGQELELDLSSLGAVNTVFAALSSKLGVPMKTSVSATILEEALNGRVSVDPLLLGQTVTKKEIRSGLVFRVESSSKSKFKLLFFDQEADGGLSLAMQEDSRRSGKITCAGMYFLGFPVYSLDHTITSMSQEKDPETALFKSLDGFHQCEVTELKAGTHIFAVYGDNFFKSVSYTIQVLCAVTFTQEKEDLRSAQEMLLIDELLKQRNEIHSAYTTAPLIERSSSKNRLRKSLFKKAVAEAPASIDREDEEEEGEESSRQRNKKPNTSDDESETLKKKTRWYNLHLKLDKKKPC